MQRISSVDLPTHVGERVALAGWLYRLRRLSSVAFLILRDGQGLAQVVVDASEQLELLGALPPESVLRVEGEVVASAQAPRGVELRARELAVLEKALAPPPFELHRPHIPAQLPTLLDHAAVSLRHPRQRALWRLAAVSVEGFRHALRTLRFTEVFTPKLVATATEGGANVFGVDYFGRAAYLAQSPQFYKQMLVGVFERVFEIGPVFRAEPHDTPRHLNQYTSLDAELGFVVDHRDVMAVVERAICGMLEALRAEAVAELELLGVNLPREPRAGEWRSPGGSVVTPVVDFFEAQRLIEQATGERVVGEPDLSPAHERWLGEWGLHEHGSDFLFVTGYPLAKRPFYTHPDPLRSEQSNSFDLLFRGLELVTGGQRLHRYADYLAALAARGMTTRGLEGYLEAFAHGMPPHGGFALGLERWVARLAGVANVRETTLFPRDLQRLTP
jgi:nondiscriminating aspartyl-tRNA synthetase